MERWIEARSHEMLLEIEAPPDAERAVPSEPLYRVHRDPATEQNPCTQYAINEIRMHQQKVHE
jgi:hypothetical protein